MEKYIFKCTNCSKIFKPSLSTLECFSCNDPLIIEYNNTRKISSDYIQLPLKSKYNLTLGEGNTPIIKMDKFSRLFGLDNVFAKLEFLNPTGSFKDRGSQILLSVICENKINEIVEDSSGNAGASISSYSARAGVKANIFVPSSAPLAKINQINVYGGKIHKVEGPRENATKETIEIVANTLTDGDFLIPQLSGLSYQSKSNIGYFSFSPPPESGCGNVERMEKHW